MKNKFTAVFLILMMTLGTIGAYAAGTGTVLQTENFDSGYGSLTKSGDVSVGKHKNETVAILNEKGDLTYAPKASDTGWDDSLRTTYRIKMSDWTATTDPMLIIRIKSQANTQTYISYYSSNGFNLQRLYPSGAGKTLAPNSGPVSADASQWHEITTECVVNSDGTNTVRIYFDGDKQLEVHDEDTADIPSRGGFMIRNYYKTPVYISDITTESVVVTTETYEPDDPAPDAVGTAYEEDSALLRLLGIMDNYDNNMFRGDYVMTRSEFLKCIINMLGYGDVAANMKQKSGFDDVPDELAGYVSLAEGLGIINGYDSRSFGPNNAMTFDEAVKMLVCALGYGIGDIAYPVGYISKAGENGFLKGIRSYDATRGTMARLLVNALDVPVNRIYEYKGGSYTLEKGESVLEQKNIITDTGIVTDNGISSFIGMSNLSDGYVCIDHNKMRVGNTSVKKYFGYSVDYYAIEKDDVYEIIYARAADENNVIKVASEDIAPGTDLSYFKYFDNEKEKKTKISKICNFIKNGVAKPGASAADLQPTDGYVTLIDNDGDDTADVIFVYDFVTVVADSFAESTKTVYNKIRGGINIVLDDEDADADIYKNGSKIEFSGLKAGDVIKAAISENGKYTYAVASADKVVGTVTSSDTEYITVDDESYKFSGNITNPTIDLGAVYSVSLDYEGRAAYFEYNSGQNRVYGYLRKAAAKDGMEATAEIEIFAANGEWRVYTLADKIRLNGRSVSGIGFLSTSEMLDAETGTIKPQLVAYKVNGKGLISEINTGKTDTADDSELNMREVSSAKYKFPNKSFNSTYFISNAVLFSIPTEDTDNDDAYRVTNYTYLINDKVYNTVYVYGIKDNVAEACVIEENMVGATPYGGCSVIAIDKIINALKPNGDTGMLIQGYYNNAYGEWFVENGLDISSLEKGDGIQFTLNAKNEIANFICRTDESNLAYSDNGFDTSPRFITGRVCKVYPAAKRFQVNLSDSTEVSDSSIWAECSATTPKCYIYNRKTGKMSLASFDDIETGCDIFLRMEREWLYDIIIYKNN